MFRPSHWSNPADARLPAGRRATRAVRRGWCALGWPGDQPIAAAGIAASSDAFVLTLLGHGNIAVYDASLSGVGHRPVAADGDRVASVAPPVQLRDNAIRVDGFTQPSLADGKEYRMTTRKGAGLLMSGPTCPSDKEKEFNRWYNEEHLAERLSVPGFLSARALRGGQGRPEASGALRARERCRDEKRGVHERVDNSTPGASATGRRRSRNDFIRNITTMIHPKALSPRRRRAAWPRRCRIGRKWTSRRSRCGVQRLVQHDLRANYERLPGVIRGRRYRAWSARHVPSRPTSSSIPGVGERRMARPRDASPVTKRIRPHMKHTKGSPGVWVKTFEAQVGAR